MAAYPIRGHHQKDLGAPSGGDAVSTCHVCKREVKTRNIRFRVRGGPESVAGVLADHYDGGKKCPGSGWPPGGLKGRP